MAARSSNCTFMELKSVEELRENPDLKFKLYLYGIEMTQGSNTQLTGKSVQIVPLWNWNGGFVKGLGNVACSNCTFMELKFVWFPTLIFHQLFKLYLYGIEIILRIFSLFNLRIVQIVPLWNWNKNVECREWGLLSSNCTFMELK